MKKQTQFFIGLGMGLSAILFIVGAIVGFGIIDLDTPTLVPTRQISSRQITEPSPSPGEEALASVTQTPPLTVTKFVVVTPVPTGTLEATASFSEPLQPTAISPALAGEPITHTVVANETLESIARLYGTDVQTIRVANGLTSDLIWPDQELIIPAEPIAIEGVTPIGSGGDITPTASSTLDAYQGDWQHAILEGDLAAAYPLTVERPRYTLHYSPDGLPEQNLETILAKVDNGIAMIEGPLGIYLEGHFDVYVASRLFGRPNLALRGRSFSSLRRLFFLWDGTGSSAERQYIITHEMTHTFTWNSIGRPSSVMLHEGVAVFTGMPSMEAAGYILLEDFCAACYQADHLPLPAAGAPFMGHIYDLENYFSAGCFVKYLIETRGAAKFAQIYTTSDYSGVYGMTLTELQNEWLAHLEAKPLPPSLNPDELVYYVDAVGSAYERLFDLFSGQPAHIKAYQALDQARIAMLAGQFDTAQSYLDQFNVALETR